MPTRCSICGKFKNAKTHGHFQLLSKSQYEKAIEIHKRVNPEPGHAARACPRCYRNIRLAEVNDDKVVMLPSRMGRDAGSGVFAHKELEPGEFVTDYTGLVVRKKYVKKMPTTSHMRTLNSDCVIDGRAGRVKYGNGLGSMINRAPKGSRPLVKMYNSPNPKTKIPRVTVRVPLKSKGGHRIAAGTELTQSYGKSYRLPPSKLRKSLAGRPPRSPPSSNLSVAFKKLSKARRE